MANEDWSSVTASPCEVRVLFPPAKLCDAWWVFLSKSMGAAVEMNGELQERRERQRGDDILTRIEDVTYSVLRNPPENSARNEDIRSRTVTH